MPFPTKKKRNRIAQAIFGLRTATGITQQELANRIGVSLTTVGRMEKNEEDGKFTPTWRALEELEKIAKECGLPKLADVFAEERQERTKALSKDLTPDFFGYSGFAKQISIEDFAFLVDAMNQLEENWREAKKLLERVKLSGDVRQTQWVELQAAIDTHLNRAEGIVHPYAAAPSATVQDAPMHNRLA